MPLQTEVSTLSGWLRSAEAMLRALNLPSPRHDAERLAAHGLGMQWSELWTKLGDPLDRSPLDPLLARRASGEPLAYILGSTVFFGVELECGPGVLVPRPETETLVDVALELIADREQPVVVDIGTGTGAIPIAIAVSRPDARLWATDIGCGALRIAERNVTRTGCLVRLVHGDLFEALPVELSGRCDLVVSNPPYVAFGAHVPPDVLSEPREAVFAGPVGDEVLRRLAREAGRWVAPKGAVAFEIGTADQVSALSALEDFGPPHVRRDRTDRPRVVWARR